MTCPTCRGAKTLADPDAGAIPCRRCDGTGEVDERRAPVQGDMTRGGRWERLPGSIAWSEHVAVWEAYAKRFGRRQSAERIAERGGFGYGEIVMLTGSEPKTWTARGPKETT